VASRSGTRDPDALNAPVRRPSKTLMIFFTVSPLVEYLCRESGWRAASLPHAQPIERSLLRCCKFCR
jgi:hypothetical protein